MKIFNNNISFQSLILFTVFALLTFYIPFNEFGCTRNQIIGVVLVLLALFSNTIVNAMQITYFVPYVSATAFSLFGTGLHIITLLEFIFFVKVLAQYKLSSKELPFLLAVVFLELFPIIVFEMPLAELLKLICCILLFICFVKVVIKNKGTLELIYMATALGVLSSCIAGMYYVRPVSEEVFDKSITWLRYCGLWTDPNFLGCFCLIGILSLFRLKPQKFVFQLMIWAICAVIFYYGTLTMSRTYLVVFALLLGVYFYRSMKGSGSMAFVAILVLAVAIPALIGYVEMIENNRVVGNAESVTSGRFEQTIALLSGQLSDFSLLTGCGFNNWEYIFTLAPQRGASHNTYADIILQFGLVGIITIIVLLTKYWKTVKEMAKFLTTINGLPMICLLFYIGTLSASHYEFVYVIAALFYSEYKAKPSIVMKRV